MATTASEIIRRVGILLNDEAFTRWTIQELVLWFNDGQRAIVTLRPDATSRYVTATLPAGVYQSLDTITETAALNPFKLLDITRNLAVAGAKGVVRQCTKESLDNSLPTWPAATATIDVSNFMFDPRTPRSFYVYPASTGATQVEVVLSTYPLAVAIPSAVSGTYLDVAGTMSVLDIYASPLMDYILFRALMKDSEAAETSARASVYFQSFTSSLNTEQSGTVGNSPTPAR